MCGDLTVIKYKGYVVKAHNVDTCRGHHYQEDEWYLEGVGKDIEECVSKIICDEMIINLVIDYVEIFECDIYEISNGVSFHNEEIEIFDVEMRKKAKELILEFKKL